MLKVLSDGIFSLCLRNWVGHLCLSAVVGILYSFEERKTLSLRQEVWVIHFARLTVRGRLLFLTRLIRGLERLQSLISDQEAKQEAHESVVCSKSYSSRQQIDSGKTSLDLCTSDNDNNHPYFRPADLQRMQLERGYKRWRYHRRLLDYRSPYFQLKFPWIIEGYGIIEFLYLKSIL